LRRSRYAAISCGLAAAVLNPVAGEAAAMDAPALGRLPADDASSLHGPLASSLAESRNDAGLVRLAQAATGASPPGIFGAPMGAGAAFPGAGPLPGTPGLVPPVVDTRFDNVADEPFSGLLSLRDQAANPSAPVWVIVPQIALQTIASDNIDHRSSGKRSDIVGIVTPSVSIGAETLRLQGQFLYSALLRRSLNTSLQNRTSQYGVLSSKATVIPGLFFFDLQGSARELPRQGASINDPALLSDSEAVQLYTYSASPYLNAPVGSLGSMSLRYYYGQVMFDRNTDPLVTPLGTLGNLSDSENQIANAEFQMPGTIASRLSTTLRANASDLSSEGAIGSLRRAEATLRNEYQLTGTLTAIGAAGYESSSHDTFAILSRQGETWDVGARWSPNPDTSLTALYGRHFAMNGLNGNFHWRISERSTLNANYSDGLANQQMSMIGHGGGSGLNSGLLPLANSAIGGAGGLGGSSGLGGLEGLNRLGSALLQADGSDLYGDDIFRRKLFNADFNTEVYGERLPPRGTR
jgi:TonB dependent receptor